MVFPLEEQQQRVAAELQQHATVVVSDVDHHREYAAQRFDEFFPAGSATQRQSFGKRGESGNIGKAQRSGNHAPEPVWFVERPVDCEFGDVSA